MESNFDKSVKLEELLTIVNEWIVNKDKDVMDLLAYRRMNDEEWIDIEIMCYVLRDEVLDLVNWKKLYIFSSIFIDISSIYCINVQGTLKIITDLVVKQMNEECRCDKSSNRKLCAIMFWTLRNCENMLACNKKYCELMLYYFLKLIETCHHEETIDCVCFVLRQYPFGKYPFPFNKYQPSLVKLMKNVFHTEQRKYNKYWIVCNLIWGALKSCSNSLSQETLEDIFKFLLKLTEKHEDEKMITQVFLMLTCFPYDKCPFQLCKFKTSLGKLIEFAESELTTGTKNYDKHWKFCDIMFWTLKNLKNSINDKTCELMLRYLMERIDTCDHEETINRAYNALRQIPFDKFQSSLQHVIDLSEKKLNEKQHRGLCEMMKDMLLRGKDSLSEQIRVQMSGFIVKLIETCKHNETIACAWDALNQFPLSNIQSSLVQVVYFLINNLKLPRHNLQIHQNWCWLIDEILIKNKNMNDSSIFNQNLLIILLDYIEKLFEHCDHVPTKLSIVCVIEKLCVNRFWRIEQINFVKDKLLGILCYRECNHGEPLPNKMNFDQYQVYWCVRWCVDNVMKEDGFKEIPLVKISQDGFGARNDYFYDDDSCYYLKPNMPPPVCSSFPVSSGVYFYEATIVTSGPMMFGWSTRETRFIYEDRWGDKKCKIGHDKHSIGFDSYRKLVVHNSNKFSFSQLPDCEAGDVIGCLIDCVARRFVFYYKGHVMQFGGHESAGEEEYEVVKFKTRVSKGISFSTSAYYATATLSYHQQCHFNFGKSPFKFAPKDIPFSHFYEKSNGDGRKYRLKEMCRKVLYHDDNQIYWSKLLPVDNQVDLFFIDKRQNEFDDEVKIVVENIRNDQNLRQWFRTGDCKCVRYIQSIIEEMGKVIGDYKEDLVAQWIGNKIEMSIDKTEKGILLELLYPYCQLRINASNLTKHRYICIVLSHLIKYSHIYLGFINYIRDEVFTYLTRTLTDTSDKWTQMFVLIALDNLKLSEEEKKTILGNTKIMKFLKEWENIGARYIDFLFFPCTLFFTQLHFISEHFLINVLCPSSVPRTNPVTLNCNDHTQHLKMSLDLLSARSDWQWQSVRSFSHANKGIYYFEALLLTNGPMRIGWSTKRTEIESTEVGEDKFSIALDGYTRCVWHKDREFKLKNIQTSWKAGDVIGCLIEKIKSEDNKKRKRFLFTLNGQPISYTARIYSSTLPYYASLSLSSHQQVHLNFGQSSFKHPPKKDYWDFYQYIQSNPPSVDFRNATVTNAIISTNSSSITARDININSDNLSQAFIDVDKQKFTDEDTAYIACPICQANISTKRLKSDRCCHIEYTPGEIPSICPESTSTPITSKCPMCHKSITTKLLRFTCCDHLQFCFECGWKLGDCLKCKQTSASTSSAPQLPIHPTVQCQLCEQIKPSRALQFVDCDHMKLCRDCVPDLLDCPKCKANRSASK